MNLNVQAMPSLAAGWAWLCLSIRMAPWPAPQRVDDAAAVRALADSVRWESPGFASDLDAAAARYERELERALR